MTAAVRDAAARRDRRQRTAKKPRTGASLSDIAAARRIGLRHVSIEALSIRLRRCGRGGTYVGAASRPIRDSKLVRRFARLAVPPAYENVLYAEDPAAHLQAVGRDAAGRLQYRYHPQWEQVREQRKARRLARLAKALPRIRRSIAQHLASTTLGREFAAAAVIELVAHSAIRPGSEGYIRLHGTRGAATLLKSNVIARGRVLTLKFRSKGGKLITKELRAPRLAKAIAWLRRLPGRRLFRYRGEDGNIRNLTAHEVNAFLRRIANAKISLKDFRTLLASASVLEALAHTEPAPNERQRRKQVRAAVQAVADDLANTVTICRRSYVHDAVVAAFEDGALGRFSKALKGCRSPVRRARILAKVVTTELS